MIARLRMVADAAAAVISALTTSRAQRAADNERNHLLLGGFIVAGRHRERSKP